MKQQVIDFDAVTDPTNFVFTGRRFKRVALIVDTQEPTYDPETLSWAPTGYEHFSYSRTIGLVDADMHTSFLGELLRKVRAVNDDDAVRRSFRIPFGRSITNIKVVTLDDPLQEIEIE